MKKIEIKICKVCGKICDNSHGSFNGKTGMCRKHNDQLKKYGKTLDTNPRTVWDPNEIRVLGTYAEIDTYTFTGEVLNTNNPDPVSSLITEANSEELVEANALSLLEV